ncbi:MAG: presqualene diphosphate synthase HpnD [Candidatus Kapabacteria bacterium]|nr:presqualene diphosphate synthase HpnD [Ignavibacteria bacterium]MBP6509859.1 presqualene diphosphate synthase HpnD [Candidatus Kapabacteria bacterium]MBK6418436.1 presqualene diphosphate synthase HpnD [Ignavibacteria bacterium]MBK7577752.1 presqualene diphosphate synthase HpnD [Ignavibacteria bacterium]MBK9183660.1 presqualene diphosphate synthase HpnD [Ignavibacteria bacterium]
MSTHLYTDAEDGLVLTTQGSTSFHYSFGFLPKEERNAIRTVYAFARRIDDIVDEDPSMDPEVILKKRQRLQWWRTEIEAMYAPSQELRPSPIDALGIVVRRFGIPKQYLLTIIDGCERDLTQRRYETFAELKEYCYSVASAVGLISIEIFGYRHEETRQYAINLGYALQLTNILRDVKQDKDRGYIYIPKEDLQRFKYTEEDLKAEIYDERFVDLMQFQAQRARDFYHEARALLRPDERMTMVAAEIMDAIYYRLLEKIELSDYRVFTKRIRVSAIHKIVTALRIWVGSKLFVKRLR